MLADTLIAVLRCPVCGDGLVARPGALRCAAGHSFDVARQGYVNLLTGTAPAGADTAEMVSARAALLADGLLDPVTAAVIEAVPAGPGLALDVGAGTGHHLAAVLAARPDRHGIALDVAKAAARVAAKAHPRMAAVVADVWRRLPLADASVDVVLDLFAPRNGPEFHRVLRPGGRLIVVTPAADHLAELIGPLGLLSVDPAKADRLAQSLGQSFAEDQVSRRTYPLALDRAQAERFVAMGPSAWHTESGAVAAELARWPEPITTTVSVDVRVYRRRG